MNLLQFIKFFGLSVHCRGKREQHIIIIIIIFLISSQIIKSNSKRSKTFYVIHTSLAKYYKLKYTNFHELKSRDAHKSFFASPSRVSSLWPPPFQAAFLNYNLARFMAAEVVNKYHNIVL